MLAAAWALADGYKQSDGSATGPLFVGFEIIGNEIILSFSHAQGLKAGPDGWKGFAISGDDQKWVRADARIED